MLLDLARGDGIGVPDSKGVPTGWWWWPIRAAQIWNGLVTRSRGGRHSPGLPAEFYAETGMTPSQSAGATGGPTGTRPRRGGWTAV